jgi:hypothetical protein
MKQESDYNKTDYSIIADDKRQDGVEQTMTPDCLPGDVSGDVPAVGTGAGIGVNVAEACQSGKVKVIPLRQEDVDADQVGSGRKRTMIGFVVALSIVLGFIIMRSSGFSVGRQSDLPAADAQAESKSPTVTGAAINWKIPGLIKDARDITRPAIAELPQVPQSSDISVSGIVAYSDGNISAMIDDRLAKAGDVVEGVMVYKITEDFVVFEKNGVRWVKKVE